MPSSFPEAVLGVVLVSVSLSSQAAFLPGGDDLTPIRPGEMTILKQRFFRWNFFFVNGLWHNLLYLLFSWQLGIWEIGTKFFVLQEVYETLLYLLAPFVLPISFLMNPVFTAILTGFTTAMYVVNAIIFNEIHLRLKKERVSIICLIYFIPYKFVLTLINIISCYWYAWPFALVIFTLGCRTLNTIADDSILNFLRSIFKYAQYFAVYHPKVIEDEKAVDVVLNLDQVDSQPATDSTPSRNTRRTRQANLNLENAGSTAEQIHAPPPSHQHPAALRRGLSIRAEMVNPTTHADPESGVTLPEQTMFRGPRRSRRNISVKYTGDRNRTYRVQQYDRQHPYSQVQEER
jgi:hypothetical protein